MVEPTNNEEKSAFEEEPNTGEPVNTDVAMDNAGAEDVVMGEAAAEEEVKPVGQSISGMVNQQFAV